MWDLGGNEGGIVLRRDGHVVDAVYEGGTVAPANICAALEDALGYHFKDQRLVMEAVNHPTSGTGGATHQRLEFLGDGEYRRSERIKVIVIDKSLPGSSY